MKLKSRAVFSLICEAEVDFVVSRLHRVFLTG